MTESLWTPGTQILARYIYGGKVQFADPMTVVSDTPDRLLTYLCAGTKIQWSNYDRATRAFSSPRPRLWQTRNALKIFERDAWFAIWCMWNADDWGHEYWYVDFQRPVRRAGGGIVIKDLALDILVAPDLSWRWKDEDHFAMRQEEGLISREEAEEVRKDAERVIARIESRAAPFNEPWPGWRPDVTWPIPGLPDDWDRPA